MSALSNNPVSEELDENGQRTWVYYDQNDRPVTITADNDLFDTLFANLKANKGQTIGVDKAVAIYLTRGK